MPEKVLQGEPGNTDSLDQAQRLVVLQVTLLIHLHERLHRIEAEGHSGYYDK